MYSLLQPLSEKLDVYSMGMVFYTMLAGKPPFEGKPAAQKMIMDGIPPAVDPSWDSGYVEVSSCSAVFPAQEYFPAGIFHTALSFYSELLSVSPGISCMTWPIVVSRPRASRPIAPQTKCDALV